MLLLLLVLLCGSCCCWGKQGDVGAVHLSLDDDTSAILVQWSSANKDATLRWGKSRSGLDLTSEAVSEPLEDDTHYMHTAKLAPVALNTRYYYQCGSGAESWSEVFSFVRSGSVEERVSFVTFGDTGVHVKSAEVTLDAVKQHGQLDETDFVFHAGDLAYAFKNWTRWSVFMDRIQPIASRLPYLVCTGNRDDLADVDKRFRMPLRPGSNARRNLYYSFRMGLVYGLAVAVGGQVPYGDGSEQLQWLAAELATAAAARADASDPTRWVVVWAHTPMYSSSDGHAGGNAEMRTAMEALFVEHGVALVVAGDDHVYERSFPRFRDTVAVPPPEQVVGADTLIVDPKYPVSFTVGTGGIELDGWKSPSERPIWSAHREITHGFLRVVATPTMLTSSFVRASDGKVLDVMHLQLSSGESRGSSSSGGGTGWFTKLLVLTAILVGIAYFFRRSKPSGPKIQLYK